MHPAKLIKWDAPAPDLAEQIQALYMDRCAAVKAAHAALVEVMPEEQRAAVYGYTSAKQEQAYLDGVANGVNRMSKRQAAAQHLDQALAPKLARVQAQAAAHQRTIEDLQQQNKNLRAHNAALLTSAGRREAGRNLVAENEALHDELRRLRAQLQQVPARHVAENIRANRLERQARDLQTELEITRGAPAGLALLAAAPTPAPRVRRPRDQVVTDAPFGVDAVARDVEDFVRRQGRCSKVDVSAAFPHARAYLSAAYRHLHASRRVHVDGYTLKPWPHPVKEAR